MSHVNCEIANAFPFAIIALEITRSTESEGDILRFLEKKQMPFQLVNLYKIYEERMVERKGQKEDGKRNDSNNGKQWNQGHSLLSVVFSCRFPRAVEMIAPFNLYVST